MDEKLSKLFSKDKGVRVGVSSIKHLLKRDNLVLHHQLFTLNQWDGLQSSLKIGRSLKIRLSTQSCEKSGAGLTELVAHKLVFLDHVSLTNLNCSSRSGAAFKQALRHFF